jgi:hypothetical protein
MDARHIGQKSHLTSPIPEAVYLVNEGICAPSVLVNEGICAPSVLDMNPRLAGIYENYRLTNCKISQPNQYKEQEATTENRPFAIDVVRLFVPLSNSIKKLKGGN